MIQIQLKRLLFLVLLTTWIAGCTHYPEDISKSTLVLTTEAFTLFRGEYENTAYFEKHKPQSIAVAPFADQQNKNFSMDANNACPAMIVRRGMYNHIASLPFKDVELFEVDKRLKNAGIQDVLMLKKMLSENPRKLKSILGTDAIITGDVTHFDRLFVGIYSQVAVGVEVKMWDLASGNLLWRAKHVSRAHGGGLSISPVGLALAAVASVWNLRQTELLNQTDNLFREIVSTIELPESFISLQTNAPSPNIMLFTTLNAEKPFTAGRKIGFQLIGDPNCTAYMDLGDYKTGIALHPVPENVKQALSAQILAAIQKKYAETGHESTPELLHAVESEFGRLEVYEGNYTVEPGNEQYGLTAKGYLIDGAGRQNSLIDSANRIDIDGVPPEAIPELIPEALNKKVKLTWTKSSDPGVAKYEAWMSRTPLSGFDKIADGETTGLIIDALDNFEKYYLKIRAVDRAGNSGEFSPVVTAIPLPEPNLYALPTPGPTLSGVILERILLKAEKNPFTIQGDLQIINGGAVYAEPGVEMLFSPNTKLIVSDGDFIAYGSAAKPVLMRPLNSSNESGAWSGIIFQRTNRAVLNHVVITGAKTGVLIQESAPIIFQSKIQVCSHAGIHMMSHAKPTIQCCDISGIDGMGGIIIEGEDVSPVLFHNKFQDNIPFHVQNYSPFKIDIAGNYWGDDQPSEDAFLGDLIWVPFLAELPVECPISERY